MSFDFDGWAFGRVIHRKYTYNRLIGPNKTGNNCRVSSHRLHVYIPALKLILNWNLLQFHCVRCSSINVFVLAVCLCVSTSTCVFRWTSSLFLLLCSLVVTRLYMVFLDRLRQYDDVNENNINHCRVLHCTHRSTGTVRHRHRAVAWKFESCCSHSFCFSATGRPSHIWH